MEVQEEDNDIMVVEPPPAPVINLSDDDDDVTTSQRAVCTTIAASSTHQNQRRVGATSAHSDSQRLQHLAQGSRNQHMPGERVPTDCVRKRVTTTTYLLLDSDSDYDDVEYCEGPLHPSPQGDSGSKGLNTSTLRQVSGEDANQQFTCAPKGPMTMQPSSRQGHDFSQTLLGEGELRSSDFERHLIFQEKEETKNEAREERDDEEREDGEDEAHGEMETPDREMNMATKQSDKCSDVDGYSDVGSESLEENCSVNKRKPSDFTDVVVENEGSNADSVAQAMSSPGQALQASQDHSVGAFALEVVTTRRLSQAAVPTETVACEDDDEEEEEDNVDEGFDFLLKSNSLEERKSPAHSDRYPERSILKQDNGDDVTTGGADVRRGVAKKACSPNAVPFYKSVAGRKDGSIIGQKRKFKDTETRASGSEPCPKYPLTNFRPLHGEETTDVNQDTQHEVQQDRGIFQQTMFGLQRVFPSTTTNQMYQQLMQPPRPVLFVKSSQLGVKYSVLFNSLQTSRDPRDDSSSQNKDQNPGTGSQNEEQNSVCGTLQMEVEAECDDNQPQGQQESPASSHPNVDPSEPGHETESVHSPVSSVESISEDSNPYTIPLKYHETDLLLSDQYAKPIERPATLSLEQTNSSSPELTNSSGRFTYSGSSNVLTAQKAQLHSRFRWDDDDEDVVSDSGQVSPKNRSSSHDLHLIWDDEEEDPQSGSGVGRENSTKHASTSGGDDHHDDTVDITNSNTGSFSSNVNSDDSHSTTPVIIECVSLADRDSDSIPHHSATADRGSDKVTSNNIAMEKDGNGFVYYLPDTSSGTCSPAAQPAETEEGTNGRYLRYTLSSICGQAKLDLGTDVGLCHSEPHPPISQPTKQGPHLPICQPSKQGPHPPISQPSKQRPHSTNSQPSTQGLYPSISQPSMQGPHPANSQPSMQGPHSAISQPSTQGPHPTISKHFTISQPLKQEGSVEVSQTSLETDEGLNLALVPPVYVSHKKPSHVFPVHFSVLNDVDFMSLLRKPKLSKDLHDFLLKVQNEKILVCEGCQELVLSNPAFQWGKAWLKLDYVQGVLMITLSELVRQNLTDISMLSHPMLVSKNFPAVWSMLTSRSGVQKNAVSLVYFLFVMEDMLHDGSCWTLSKSEIAKHRLRTALDTPIRIVEQKNHEKHSFWPSSRYICSSVVDIQHQRVWKNETDMAKTRKMFTTSMGKMNSSKSLDNFPAGIESTIRGATSEKDFIGVWSKQFTSWFSYRQKNLRSFHLMYPFCPCERISLLDKKERQWWRKIETPGSKDSTELIENLGLLRFMGHNVFCFLEQGNVYISVVELEQRNLMPENYHLVLTKYFLDHLETTSDVRPISKQELAFVTQFFSLSEDQYKREKEKYVFSPYGLQQIYIKLKKSHYKYEQQVKAVYYMMRLGHHCPWSFLVTPPTTQLHQVPGYPSPDGREQPAAMIIPASSTTATSDRDEDASLKTMYYDGGGGTPPAIKGVGDLLNEALKTLICKFGVQSVAEPFCSCRIAATELHKFGFLQFEGVELSHVTHMKFAGHLLHCWKRCDGFYVSVAELQSKGLMVEGCLNNPSNFLLANERVFLNSFPVGQLNSQDVLRLIEIRRLHDLYKKCEDSRSLGHQRFYIKLWKHSCAVEKDWKLAPGPLYPLPTTKRTVVPASDTVVDLTSSSDGDGSSVNEASSSLLSGVVRAIDAVVDLSNSFDGDDSVVNETNSSRLSSENEGCNSQLSSPCLVLPVTRVLVGPSSGSGIVAFSVLRPEQSLSGPVGPSATIVRSAPSVSSSVPQVSYAMSAVSRPSSAVSTSSVALPRPTSTEGLPSSTALRLSSTEAMLSSTEATSSSTGLIPPSTEVTPSSTAFRPSSTEVTSSSTAFRPPSTEATPFSTAHRPPSTEAALSSLVLNPPSIVLKPLSVVLTPLSIEAPSMSTIVPPLTSSAGATPSSTIARSSSIVHRSPSSPHRSHFGVSRSHLLTAARQRLQHMLSGGVRSPSFVPYHAWRGHPRKSSQLPLSVRKSLPTRNSSRVRRNLPLLVSKMASPLSATNLMNILTEHSTENVEEHTLMVKFQKACKCLNRKVGVFPSYSSLQCSYGAKGPFTIHEQVGQAVVCGKLVLCVYRVDDVFFSFLDLKMAGIVQGNSMEDILREHLNLKLSLLSPDSLRMLLNEQEMIINYVGMLQGESPQRSGTSILISARLLRLLLYCEGVEDHCFYLHQMGHICPQADSEIYKVQKHNGNMRRVQSAWMRAFHWWKDLDQHLATRRKTHHANRSTEGGAEAGSTHRASTEDFSERGMLESNRVVFVRCLDKVDKRGLLLSQTAQASDYYSLSPVKWKDVMAGQQPHKGHQSFQQHSDQNPQMSHQNMSSFQNTGISDPDAGRHKQSTGISHQNAEIHVKQETLDVTIKQEPASPGSSVTLLLEESTMTSEGSGESNRAERFRLPEGPTVTEESNPLGGTSTLTTEETMTVKEEPESLKSEQDLGSLCTCGIDHEENAGSDLVCAADLTNSHGSVNLIYNHDPEGQNSNLHRVIPKISENRTTRVLPCEESKVKDVLESSALEGVILDRFFKQVQVPDDEKEVRQMLETLPNFPHLVLMGVLLVEDCCYMCLNIDGRLYVNWAEVVKELPQRDRSHLFMQAQRLHAYLYVPPVFINKRLSCCFGGDLNLLQSAPWICVNTLVAIYNMGSGLLAREVMLKRFCGCHSQFLCLSPVSLNEE